MAWDSVVALVKRIRVPITASTTQAQIEAMAAAPFAKSGKFGLAWVYFAVVLLLVATAVRWYHTWGDKTRIAMYRKGPGWQQSTSPVNATEEYELPSATTERSTAHLFPQPYTSSSSSLTATGAKTGQSSVSTIAPLNNTIAFLRWIFYRPIPVLRIWRFCIVFPSLGTIAIVLASFLFCLLFCFVPQPLYFESISWGSPPLAIRAGMIATSLVPWVFLLGLKANFITYLTGIDHERLNVLHRWAAYVCLFMALVHTLPFYITPIWNDGAEVNYQKFVGQNIYVYGTGLAALVPLAFLCLHSLPVLREKLYELFVFMHLPASLIFLALLFWHSKNYLASWGYLWATLACWLVSSIIRLFYLNWTNPFRISFLIGEESAVTLLPENAVKVTVPTRMRWRPGQYVYLRMPGISLLGNHPFTIASLCSDDFPSEYGEKYRDLTLVFRPFGGFTRQVLKKALKHGPYRTYTAFLEGPYGGMQRELAAFDDVIFFAGGSGITAIAGQLLYLIKRMRDGKAVTRRVRVIWALKSPETMEWFKEELRICRDYAPLNSVHCHFYITGGRETNDPLQEQHQRDLIQEKINNILSGIDKRSSAFIRQEAAGDQEREKELRRENEDGLAPLPQAYMAPRYGPQQQQQQQQQQEQDTTPRFASLSTLRRDGWRTDYTRPDIPRILTEYSQSFGRRTCVYICGPPAMRVAATKTVASLQRLVMTNPAVDEIFLHAENYNI
ncbi:hypothetical protein ASPZODRAFT_154842 [Penicilliopsis zonata CBS 506.65]|uniref:ferric-chelate reductase (NADPH) n=1 Tax=Penicilliopsis zonata CBS 506.65 TaxID=1073090 RepID=A0A1L9S7K2_9EURO|nr:hypothetical protein ASPZODRAFT_154842 [Penicilliopsis zonata CBS 506.65]OJJ43123.1 hypothetical protein ASPZODRAFT_154842 [Penicilliopsis zonata CBS 506.65]